MKVLIRVDASVVIGSGHVMRCLTLAKALRARNAQVLFACRELSGHLLVRIAAEGFGVIALPAVYPGESNGSDPDVLVPWHADWVALEAALAGNGLFDWLIVDHYGLAADWELAARVVARRIAVIDDLSNRSHDCELLLDQNLTATTEAYLGAVPEHCRRLLGPRYALLRPEFAGTPLVIRSQARCVLVNFGGVDPTGEIIKVLDALVSLPEVEVDIVAGLINPAWDDLVRRVQGYSRWRLHRHIADFANLMRTADLFVGAGGATTWERAALGLPTICIAVAPNQIANARLMAVAGGHVFLGVSAEVSVEAIEVSIKKLLADHEGRKQMAQHAYALVDGHGAARVTRELLSMVPVY